MIVGCYDRCLYRVLQTKVDNMIASTKASEKYIQNEGSDMVKQVRIYLHLSTEISCEMAFSLNSYT